MVRTALFSCCAEDIEIVVLILVLRKLKEIKDTDFYIRHVVKLGKEF
jgi:hypothetical protein